MGAIIVGKMPSRPPAPESLPKYITEGVPKQDNKLLHELSAWIEELLDHREEQLTAEIEADDTIESVEHTDDGTIITKKQLCGKDNCKCTKGDLHGPYKWKVTYENGETNWDYRGKA